MIGSPSHTIITRLDKKRIVTRLERHESHDRGKFYQNFIFGCLRWFSDMLDVMLKAWNLTNKQAAVLTINCKDTVSQLQELTLSALALILAASLSATRRRSSASTSFLLQNSSISALVMLYTGTAAMIVAALASGEAGLWLWWLQSAEEREPAVARGTGWPV